jgi:hypothetical protein
MPPRAKRKRASDPASPADSPMTSRPREGCCAFVVGGSTRSSHATAAADADADAAAAVQDKGQEAPVLVAVKGQERLPAAFASQRQQGLLVDATLAVGGTRITAHKNVLVAFSPYLKGLFTSGLAESSRAAAAGPVKIHNVQGAAVAACVDCFYSGAIALTGATVCAVMQAANLLGLTPIEQVACAFFMERLEPETALDALGFAEDMAAGGVRGTELHSQVAAYVREHFADIAATPAFVRLAASSVASLLGSDRLWVQSEEVVLSALRRWYEHDVEGRVAALETLVPLVRFPLLPAEAQLRLSTEPLLVALGKLGSTTTNQLWVECLPAFSASAAAANCPRLRPRRGYRRAFTFASVDNTNLEGRGDSSSGRFDQAGVLHHIATEGGTSAYVNPHTAGRVVASRSSQTRNFPPNAIEFFVAGPPPLACCSTMNRPNSWMAVDLGAGRQLTVNHYALRHGFKSNNCVLRNWEIQGSEDGVAWTALRRHENDQTMEEKGYFVAHWAVEGVTKPYRHFRVHQHGLNACGGHYLMCNGIELYGWLIEA